jgi:ribosomal protein S27E
MTFIQVSCNDCGNETNIFARSTTVVACNVCSRTLTSPSSGRAKLIGCKVVETLE